MATAVASALTQPPGEPPWRDADAAVEQLNAGKMRLISARQAFLAAERRLDDLRETLQQTQASDDDATLLAAEELQAAQDLAIDLALAAYMSGDALTDISYVLDAGGATDFAYRKTLLTESADAVARTTEQYLELRSGASPEVLDLAAEIADMDRAIELAAAEIIRAELALPDLEWVVFIAEIHRQADDALERTGRIDPTAEQWAEVRRCESRENYATNTGNTFYGAYQFTASTWLAMGGTGLASDASVEEQDARARLLYARAGSGYGRGGSWPICGAPLPGG